MTEVLKGDTDKFFDAESGFQEFIEKLSPELVKSNVALIPIEDVKKLMVLRTQFFYITDFRVSRNVFVHDNVNHITGYTKDDFTNLNFIYNHIHAEDREFVHEFSMQSITTCKLYKNDTSNNILSTIFSIDFRFRIKNGEYIRLNRHTCAFELDKDNNMVFALSFFTDITHLKQSNFISFSCKGDYKNLFDMEGLKKKYFARFHLSKKELEILQWLSKGESATIISQKTFCSVHTIIRHRKNLLRKTGSKNTAELIRFGLENGLI